MKKLLITGVSGLLGSNLAFILRDKYSVTGQYNRHEPRIKGIGVFRCDLSGDDIFKKAVELKPDVIIHCAAITDVDHCEDHPEEAYEVNSAPAGVLARAAVETGAKMVYISTDSVYRDTPGTAYKETSPAGPVNVYSESKLRGEEITLTGCNDHLIIRTTIYGYNHRDKLSLGEWVLDNLLKKKNIGMFTDVIFNPILVNDLAAALDAMVEKDLKGVFNVDSSGALSKYDFGVKLADAFGMDRGLIAPIRIEDFKFRAKRPRNMVSDVSLVRRYVEVPTVEEGILRFRDLYRQKYHERLKKGA